MRYQRFFALVWNLYVEQNEKGGEEDDPSEQIEKPLSVGALNGFGLVSLWEADQCLREGSKPKRIYQTLFSSAPWIGHFSPYLIYSRSQNGLRI